MITHAELSDLTSPHRRQPGTVPYLVKVKNGPRLINQIVDCFMRNKKVALSSYIDSATGEKHRLKYRRYTLHPIKYINRCLVRMAFFV